MWCWCYVLPGGLPSHCGLPVCIVDWQLQVRRLAKVARQLAAITFSRLHSRSRVAIMAPITETWPLPSFRFEKLIRTLNPTCMLRDKHVLIALLFCILASRPVHFNLPCRYPSYQSTGFLGRISFKRLTKVADINLFALFTPLVWV